MNKIVNIIGAGLAGCEACYQLAKRGIKVRLFEMKPEKKSPAHKTNNFAELVCSNSLRSNDILNAVGLLKEELRKLDSLIMKVADETSVPSGGALAVDRDKFSFNITEKIKSFDNVEIIEGEVTSVNKDEITIIATYPLTSEAMLNEISSLVNDEYLNFFDAAAPIVEGDSIDYEKAFFGSRYNKGDDYLNCGMNKEEYEVFYRELVNAEAVEMKGFENNVFEGCMPIEVMAKRGENTMRFGPLKPVGIYHPVTNEKYYAVVQLRKENVENSLYNLVGFQTHLKFGEQKRVFSLIPALKNASFVRYGVMHKNTYINSPKVLNKYYALKSNPNIYFAGQITGVEGYVESTASGLNVALNVYKLLNNEEQIDFTSETAIGSLANYISNESVNGFQPMNVNFGIMKPLTENVRDKILKKTKLKDRALNIIDSMLCLL